VTPRYILKAENPAQSRPSNPPVYLHEKKPEPAVPEKPEAEPAGGMTARRGDFPSLSETTRGRGGGAQPRPAFTSPVIGEPLRYQIGKPVDHAVAPPRGAFSAAPAFEPLTRAPSGPAVNQLLGMPTLGESLRRGGAVRPGYEQVRAPPPPPPARPPQQKPSPAASDALLKLINEQNREASARFASPPRELAGFPQRDEAYEKQLQQQHPLASLPAFSRPDDHHMAIFEHMKQAGIPNRPP